jgi:hypothetical protein
MQSNRTAITQSSNVLLVYPQWNGFLVYITPCKGNQLDNRTEVVPGAQAFKPKGLMSRLIQELDCLPLLLSQLGSVPLKKDISTVLLVHGKLPIKVFEIGMT